MLLSISSSFSAMGSSLSQERFLDIDVAGGAHTISAAFGDDAIDVVGYGALHHRRAGGNSDLTDRAGM